MARVGNYIDWNCVRGYNTPCRAAVAHTYDDAFVIMKRTASPSSPTDTANSVCAQLVPRSDGVLRQRCAGGLGQPASALIPFNNNTSVVRYAQGIHFDGASHYIAGNAQY